MENQDIAFDCSSFVATKRQQIISFIDGSVGAFLAFLTILLWGRQSFAYDPWSFYVFSIIGLCGLLIAHLDKKSWQISLSIQGIVPLFILYHQGDLFYQSLGFCTLMCIALTVSYLSWQMHSAAVQPVTDETIHSAIPQIKEEDHSVSDHLQQALQEATGHSEKLHKELQEAHQEKDILLKRMNDLISDCEFAVKERDAFRTEKERLWGELFDSRQELSKLHHDLKEYAKVKQQLVELEQALEKTQPSDEVLLQLEEAKKTIEQDATTIKSTQEQLRQVQSSYDQEVLSKEVLLAELDAVKKQLSEADELKLKIKEKESQVQELAQKYQDLQARFDVEDIEGLKQFKHEIQERLSDVLQQLSTSNTHAAELEIERQSQQENLTTALSELSILKVEKERICESYEKQLAQIKPFEAMYRQLKEQFEEKSTVLDETRKELFWAQEKATLIQKELQDIKELDEPQHMSQLIHYVLQLDKLLEGIQQESEEQLKSYESLVQSLMEEIQTLQVRLSKYDIRNQILLNVTKR